MEVKMSQVIRIPENLYNRLEKHAQGFDTPANVIEKILNFYENNCDRKNKVSVELTKIEIESPNELEIIYHPGGENIFKKALLENKKAFIRLYKVDGSIENKIWNATKFSSHSDVNGNLRSGYLRGWKDKGIYKAVIAINENDID
jgi:hypothetical protein